MEIDLIAPIAENRILVAECKWKKLSDHEEARLLTDLKSRFGNSGLAKKFPRPDFRILSKQDLKFLSA